MVIGQREIIMLGTRNRSVYLRVESHKVGGNVKLYQDSDSRQCLTFTFITYD